MKISVGTRIAQEKMGILAAALCNPIGNVIFLDATNGNNGNDGQSPRHPVATLERAIALADANDTIIAAPGGSETITTGLTLADNYVKIICPCANRKQGYKISGAAIDLLTVSGTDCHIEGLIFAHTGTTGSTDGIKLAATADRAVVKNCIFDDSAIVTNFTNVGVEVVGACDDVLIDGCMFEDQLNAIKFTMATSDTCKRPVIQNCDIFVGQLAALAIASALTGSGKVNGATIRNNRFYEMKGSGAAAAAAWDGTNGANATIGPMYLEAAVDQSLIEDNTAFTAQSYTFNNLCNINAGAVKTLVGNRTATNTDLETNVTSALANTNTILDQLSGTTGIATWLA
jgi:hypothetical protein